MVINNGDKNGHQVTSVCHCIVIRNGQMYVVHIGCNDCRGCGTMTYI
jgi:hypothetical protein